MQKSWSIKPFDRERAQALSRDCNISPILARLLVNRRINDAAEAKQFLYGDISSSFDPFLLKGMDKAVERISRAVSLKEKIMAYGDYDVDGITSVALLLIILKELGADVIPYIPNRMDEGYGLNTEAIKTAHAKSVKLIITADCGIDAFDEVAYANSLGIDVIVTDHHEVKKDLIPRAAAVIDPLQEDCAYPFKHLAGVGIVYKLAQALTKGRSYNLEQHLDLVALGTVAEIVPQGSENRIFTRRGVKVIKATAKPGIRALLAVSGLEGKDISTSHIGFMLGPRINAMGRIGSPEIALDLLMADDKAEADRLAEAMNRENTSRQKIESKILESALLKIDREVNFKEHRVIVLAGEGWHSGVIGIVASRIQERYYRPTIMISLDKDKAKGSGRSIAKFNLFNALEASKDCLLDFGGHEAACGLSLDPKDIDAFRDKINAHAKSVMREEDLLPSINIDVDLPLSDMTRELIDELELLEPYGPENTRPVFVSTGIPVAYEPRFIGKNGFKVWIRTDNTACEAISFKRDMITIPSRGETMDIVYSPAINAWQGIETIQLELKDLRIC